MTRNQVQLKRGEFVSPLTSVWIILYFAKCSEEEKMKRRKFLKTSLSYEAVAGSSLVFLEKGIPRQGAPKSVKEKKED